MALEKIQEASKIVGGKIVILDVVKKGEYKKLVKHYIEIGFRELYEFSSHELELIRFYYKLS
ncbi:hypothetical protein SAMN06269117_11024 [Balnearium lithotrophicum]|uniref:Uncharacterized protein n=1 Tax=Balnearium lithotrophicum TaxID=223788 RepID=A0A521C8M0_9BACT|nr:hypothetical protein [Balnearium lithotrophicum]SMO55161.1 hypothetical protein SAMN06269117_11024 [Balnearium lithotrophicum]